MRTLLAFDDAAFSAILQAAATLIAVVGGMIAAFKAVAEMRQANIERKESREVAERELAWRKAEVSKRFLDETYQNSRIIHAFNIVDSTEFEFDANGKGKMVTATHADLAQALRVVDLTLSPDEWVIREQFDAMLLQFGTIEHYITIGLVLEADIMAPLEYFVWRCSEHEEAISRYGEEMGGKLGVAFLRRFPIYRAVYDRRTASARKRAAGTSQTFAAAD